MYNWILEWVVYFLISSFMNNKRAIYKLGIFQFLIFCSSTLAKSAYFDPK